MTLRLPTYLMGLIVFRKKVNELNEKKVIMKQYRDFQKDRLQKTPFLAVWVILFLVALASCSQDEISEVADASWAQLSVAMPTISIPVDAATRTTSATNTVYVGNGKKFRVIAFKQGDVSASGYISHGDFTVGGDNTLNTFRVPYNATYTFVCYSLENTTLPAFDKEALDITADPASDNLLYCKFDQQITSDKSLLSISFDRMFPRVQVVADATPLDANITAIKTLRLTPNYKGRLSLANGTLSTTGSSSAVSLTWGTLTAAQTQASSIASIYSGTGVVTIAIPSVTIGGKTVTDLSVQTGSALSNSGTTYRYTLKFSKNGVAPDVPSTPLVPDFGDEVYFSF